MYVKYVLCVLLSDRRCIEECFFYSFDKQFLFDNYKLNIKDLNFGFFFFLKKKGV